MSLEMSPEMMNRLKKWQKIALWFSVVSTVLTIGIGLLLMMLLHNQNFRREHSRQSGEQLSGIHGSTAGCARFQPEPL